MQDSPDPFTAYYDNDLEGFYDCTDRIVLNGYFGRGHNAGGFRHWWNQLFGDESNLNNQSLRNMAGNFSRKVRAYTAKHNIALIECKRKERKHEIAESHLPRDPNFKGLFLVIIAKAPGLKWDITTTSNGQPHLETVKPWPFVNHYHFHFIDPEWGHLTIKMSGYPPYPCQILLNGHEWVERRLQKQTISEPIRKEGNCFVGGALDEVDDVSRQLLDTEAITHLVQVVERWIYTSCLCFGLSLEEQKRTGFRFCYSCYQLEYSRNLLFEQGTMLDEVFQGLVDRTRKGLGVDKILTIFGRKRRAYIKSKNSKRRLPVRVERVLLDGAYDMTLFKVHFGKITLKIYDKAERVLRIEAVVHNVGDLRCGRVLEKLPFMLEKLRNMTNGFLEVIQAAHRAFLGGNIEPELRLPGKLGKARVAGIDFHHARIQAVGQALTKLAPSPNGFTVRDLAHVVSPDQCPHYNPRKAAYDLRKFRAKGLVEKTGGRTYRVPAKGVSQLIGLHTLRTKIIRPLLNGLSQAELTEQPPGIHPIDQHYINLRHEMRRTFQALGIAA